MKRLTRLTWLDVSKHRPVLYGFAALWIAFLHMEYKVPSSGALRLLSLFQDLGACGVEIFVLLTGAGLYRSMERDPDILHFYQKRFSRVFLPAAIVGLLYYGSCGGSFSQWLSNSVYLTFWLGENTLWYVAFILTMYLLYPFLYRIQKIHSRSLWGLLFLSLPAVFVLSSVSGNWTNNCIRGLARIPVFLFGCILAPRLEKGMKFPIWLTPAALGGFLFFAFVDRSTIAAHYFWRTLAYTCFAVFLILLITWLCEHVRPGIPGQFVYRCFAFCGGISLEIYLLFSRLHSWTVLLPDYTAGKISLLKLEAFTLILTILMGWLLSRMCSSLIKDFQRLEVPPKSKEIQKK